MTKFYDFYANMGKELTRGCLRIFKNHFYFIFPLLFIPLIPFSTSTHPSQPPPTITTLLSLSMNTFSFLLKPSTPYPPPRAVSLLSLSTSLYSFCLLVPFVHQIPHISEIIGYLSFSDWFISLSIMFSRSIHAVIKGKFFFIFLQPSSIPLCKCPIVVLSTYLLMDTWAAFKSWLL